jgi:starch phosphorylase
VQVIYAGKAHPNDTAGKALIQAIVSLARKPEFRRRLVFLEDYDMAVARYMVQGCDVWLNTPLRPLEASGTSGMKAQANGVLNVSTLDGWWDEAWHSAEAGSQVGWAIGHGESYDDPAYQDEVEAAALYELLERDIVPTFYDRRSDGTPRNWIAHIKSSVAALCPEFNMHRMVKQYTEGYYEVAHARFRSLDLDQAAKARSLAAWLCRVRQAWPQLRVQSVETNGTEIEIGHDVHVRACVFLGSLRPEDVSVEAWMGHIDAEGEISDPVAIRMQASASPVSGNFVFEVDVRPSFKSGMHGLSIRVMPHHPDLITSYVPGLITWASA